LTKARIDDRFAALKAEGRAAFIAYIMAGDPDLEQSFEILSGLPAAGADLIELGFPFSDPMAEGVPIQRAAQRSLAGKTTLAKTLDLVRRFRLQDTATPIVLMGYLNPVLNWGFDAFAAAAAEAGVDGLIIVDCPPEESGPLADALDAAVHHDMHDDPCGLAHGTSPQPMTRLPVQREVDQRAMPRAWRSGKFQWRAAAAHISA
jgi:tryptophan synthase alpha chain